MTLLINFDKGRKLALLIFRQKIFRYHYFLEKTITIEIYEQFKDISTLYSVLVYSCILYSHDRTNYYSIFGFAKPSEKTFIELSYQDTFSRLQIRFQKSSKQIKLALLKKKYISYILVINGLDRFIYTRSKRKLPYLSHVVFFYKFIDFEGTRLKGIKSTNSLKIT